MRVLILTHHYPPEVGAPQTRLSGTARFLRDRGHDVMVVTAMPSYPTAALPAGGRRDVILVESPPLFLGMTGAVFGAALRAPMVLHVSDLWPAVPIELGALSNPWAIRAARVFERG